MSPRLCAALLVAAAAAWAPEAEFATLHGSSQATWRGRVDAELTRSLDALPQRTTKDESVQAVRGLLNHNYRRRAVVLLFGRVFVDRDFLPGEKVRSLVATLLSSHRLGVKASTQRGKLIASAKRARYVWVHYVRWAKGKKQRDRVERIGPREAHLVHVRRGYNFSTVYAARAVAVLDDGDAAHDRRRYESDVLPRLSRYEALRPLLGL